MEINLNKRKMKIEVGDVLIIKDTCTENLLYRLIVKHGFEEECYSVDLHNFNVANKVNKIDDLYDDYNTSYYKLIDIIKSDELELRRK